MPVIVILKGYGFSFFTGSYRRFEPFRSSHLFSFYLLLLAAGGTANAQSTFEQKAANPFDNNNDGLPDLGMAPENHDGEKHFAEIVKDFGETSMNDNGLDTGEQAKAFALGKVRDALSQQVNQHESLAITVGKCQC